MDGFVDAYRGNEEIGYQDDMGWPDLLSKRMAMMMVDDR